MPHAMSELRRYHGKMLLRMEVTAESGTVRAAAGIPDRNFAALGKGACTSKDYGTWADAGASVDERWYSTWAPSKHTIMYMLHATTKHVTMTDGKTVIYIN